MRAFRRNDEKATTMATGWAGDGAVQDQIDATVKDGIARARSKLPKGAGSTHCMQCGIAIPLARREAIVGVALCVTCQAVEDRDSGAFSGPSGRMRDARR